MLFPLKVIIIVWWVIFIIKLIRSFYILILTIVLRLLYLKKLLIFYLLSLENFLFVQIINFIFLFIFHHLYLLFRNFRLVMFRFSNLFFCLWVRNIQCSGGRIVWLWKLIKIVSLVFKWLCLFKLIKLFGWLLYEIDLFDNQI